MKNIIKIQLIALAAAGALRADSTLTWADLPAAVNAAAMADKHSEFVVVTKTGKTHKSPDLGVTPQGVELWPAYLVIPRSEISEIRVRHRGGLFYLGQIDFQGRLGEALWVVTFFSYGVLTIPFFAGVGVYGLAASPPMLVVEAIRRIGSTKILYRAAP